MAVPVRVDLFSYIEPYEFGDEDTREERGFEHIRL